MKLEPLGLAVAQGRVSIVKDLAAFGAPLDRIVISRALDPTIASWLEQVVSWSPAQRAIQACRPEALQFLLQKTNANPAVTPRGTPTVFELLQEIEANIPDMEADLRASARETCVLASAALHGWSHSTHWLFPPPMQQVSAPCFLLYMWVASPCGFHLVPT